MKRFRGTIEYDLLALFGAATLAVVLIHRFLHLWAIWSQHP